MTDEDLDGMIAEIDEDGSGTIDVEGKKYNFLCLVFYLFNLIYASVSTENHLITKKLRKFVFIGFIFYGHRIHGNDDWLRFV